jgi:protein AFG1
MSSRNLDQARRFVTLIDTMYEKKVKLVVLSAVPPEYVFDETAPTEIDDDSANTGFKANKHGDLLGTSKYVVTSSDTQFAFERAISRLIEMQSERYLLAATPQQGGKDFLQRYQISKLGEEDMMRIWERYCGFYFCCAG